MSLTVVFPFHSFKGLTVHMLKYTGSVQGQCVECPGGYIKIKYLYIWDHEGIVEKYINIGNMMQFESNSLKQKYSIEVLCFGKYLKTETNIFKSYNNSPLNIHIYMYRYYLLCTD